MLALTLFRPAPTTGPFARDFEAYYAAGATWNAGGDPWSRAVWRVERTIPGVDASRDELLPYVGPAAALPLFGALARLPHRTAVALWTMLLAIAYAAIVAAAATLCGVRRRTALLGGALLAIASGPGTSAIALGQAALLAAAGIAWALVAYERGALAGGALATLVAGIQPNLAIVLLARVRDRTALLGAALAAPAFAALTWWAGGGPGGFAAYLHRLGEHGRAEGFDAIQHTPAAIAWAFGAPAATATAAGAACALAAVAATAVAIARARLGARDGTLLAIAALPTAVPFFHEHDFVVELLPLTVLALSAAGRARALGGIAAVLICVDWLGIAQRPPAATQIVLLGFAVACAYALLATTPRMTRADAVPFAALAAAAALAVPLARAHPAPTWPDALPSGFRAPALADASAVWAAEQRAAGLEKRDPAWATLRALPLAGCVVLGVGLVLTLRRPQRG
ncbi:MAG TPA: glycosyltransferase 87 family protein [Candidatus Elarobacter sp.]